MLNKSQLVDELVDRGVGDRKHVSNMLNALTEVAVEQLSLGEDFTVPGVVKIQWHYRPPLKKGERWKKGDEVTGFGGVTSVKDADSPPVARRITLKASATAGVYRLRPKGSVESQKEFFTTRTAKAIVKRKAA